MKELFYNVGGPLGMSTFFLAENRTSQRVIDRIQTAQTHNQRLYVGTSGLTRKGGWLVPGVNI